jgi:hypothetical protein
VITKKVLLGLVAVTTAAFLFAYVASQAYLLAAFAVGLGLIWLILEMGGENPLGSVFFLAFLALAIVGSLSNAPIPIILLGLSTDLAAWDLSRFQARIADEIESDTTVGLQTKHLQKLAVTACIGFFIALLPVAIHISVNFVIFCFVMVLAMIALRRSMLYFRTDHERGV